MAEQRKRSGIAVLNNDGDCVAFMGDGVFEVYSDEPVSVEEVFKVKSEKG